MTSKTVAATKVSGSKNSLPLWSFASYPLEALEDMIRLIQLACKQKGCAPPHPLHPIRLPGSTAERPSIDKSVNCQWLWSENWKHWYCQWMCCVFLVCNRHLMRSHTFNFLFRWKKRKKKKTSENQLEREQWAVIPTCINLFCIIYSQQERGQLITDYIVEWLWRRRIHEESNWFAFLKLRVNSNIIY